MNSVDRRRCASNAGEVIFCRGNRINGLECAFFPVFKARRYREYSERLQELRTQVALSDWRKLTERITGYEQDRFITWEVSGPGFPSIGHYYGYRLEPVDGGTLVTSIYDWSGVDEQWNRGDGTWPIISELELKATLGILDRTVAQPA